MTQDELQMLREMQAAKRARAYEFLKSEEQDGLDVTTVRAPVPGGWLYVTTCFHLGTRGSTSGVHTVFVPQPCDTDRSVP